jgi:hypothetical protein
MAAVGAVLLSAAPGSASTGPVVAFAAVHSASQQVPAQCSPLADLGGTDGCFDKNPLLGPSDLPTGGAPLYTYIARMTRGYKRFGDLTEAQFLAKYRVPADPPHDGSWKYPEKGGFTINPATNRPIVHYILLKPFEHGKPVLVDRFGRDTGTYMSPALTSYAKRAIPPMSLDTFTKANPYNYHLYLVLRAFNVDAGLVAPWFGQEGGGRQYATCHTTDFANLCEHPDVADLIAKGYLEEVPLPRTLRATARGRRAEG